MAMYLLSVAKNTKAAEPQTGPAAYCEILIKVSHAPLRAVVACSYVKPKFIVSSGSDYTKFFRLRKILVHKPAQLHADREADRYEGGDEGGEAGAH